MSSSAGTPGMSGQDVGARISQGLGTAANASVTIGRHLTAFGTAMQAVQRGQPVTGGCPCEDSAYFGGADDASEEVSKELREYEASLSARTKDDMIRRLAAALKNAGVPVNPDAGLEDIVAALTKNLPDPRRTTFKEDAAAQRKVCDVIAKVLNEEFTPGATKPADRLIDTSLGPEAVCRAVGEWAHSFAMGVNTEFMAVHASVRNALHNVQVLDALMERAYDEAQRKIRADPAYEGQTGQELEALDELFRRAQSERRHQEELLKNMLHVEFGPLAEELRLAMLEGSEQQALVAKVFGAKPGSRAFADSLAASISSLGAAAGVAFRVHRALKAAGLSVRQYLDSRDFADFQRLLDEQVMATRDASKAARLIEAANTLRTNFHRRADAEFRSALEESSKLGGDGDDEPKSSIVKRVERLRTEKKVLLRDFASRMARHSADLLAAVKALGPELGKSIPLSDKTDALRDALQRLNQQRQSGERIELALVGMYLDADARERKERYTTALRAVASACSDLMGLEMYRTASAQFALLKNAIESIQKTIDYFADMITQKFGGAKDTAGGADDNDLLPEIARGGLSLAAAVDEFAYFYYVAHVRANLAQTSKELAGYGEKYDDMLGAAVASRLAALETERKTVLSRLSGLPAETETAAKEWIGDEYNTKVRFYRALQAMDLYMKAFTAALAKDPDATREIKKILDGVQVIARWFSDQTGDAVARAFDSMDAFDPTVAAPAHAFVANEPVTNIAPNSHYYEAVAAKSKTFAAVGWPSASIPSDAVRAAAAKRDVHAAYDNFQGLKNLINTFARVGDKFGATELRTQIFMSPAQIYKTLMDYLKQSALSIYSGTDVEADPINAAARGANLRPGAIYFGSVHAGREGNFKIEDRYFTLIVKAMAAKVLTTVGVYDMFERDTPLVNLTPTRMIVGGANEAEPDIIAEASELYFRLPRLAEFYRCLLWKDMDPKVRTIGMLPDLEGVFSGLVRLVFQRLTPSAVEAGEYSDLELRAVVREVNQIYAVFHEKQPERTTSAVVAAFVADINRRYGVIKKADLEAFRRMAAAVRRGEYGAENNTNYAILPGEDDDLDAERRAPSDRFALPGSAGTINPFAGRSELDIGTDADGFRALVRSFRKNLDAQFQKVTPGDFGKVSYALLVQQAENEIQRSAAWDAKFAVVARLIQGTSVVGTSADKAFMFHETVVTGLNTLSAIQHMVSGLQSRFDSLDPLALENAAVDELHKFATELAAGGAATADDLAKRATDAMIPGAAAAPAAPGAAAPAAPGAAAPAAPGAAAAPAAPGAAAAPAAPGAAAAPLNEFINTRLQANTDLSAAIKRAAAKYLTLNTLGRAHTHPSWSGQDRLVKLLGYACVSYVALPKSPSTYSSTEEAPVAKYLRPLRTLARLMVDYDAIMVDLLNNTFDAAGSGELIEVRIAPGTAAELQLNFSKLRGVIEGLMADVKNSLEIFRPYMNVEVLTRFEDGAQPGSVFWLEKYLIDAYIRHPEDVGSERSANSLDQISRMAGRAFRNLTRESRVILPVGSVITSAADWDGAFTAKGAEASRYEGYGHAFSELLFYGTTAKEFSSGLGVPASAALSANFALGGLIRVGRPGPPGGANNDQLPRAATNAAVTVGRFLLYQDAGSMLPNRSLLFAFNQLVARYLSALCDTAGGVRIYTNLITPFANGTASRAVSTPVGNTFPDLATIGTRFGAHGDPRPSAVLAQSLAWVMQRLVRDVNPTTQISDHLVDTLVGVPLYVKESMRVNLPGLIKLLDLLVRKGELLKQVMQNTAVRLDRPSQLDDTPFPPNVKIALDAVVTHGANWSSYPADALEALEDLAPAMEGAALKPRLLELAEAVMSGAYALSSVAGEALKELQDAPVFFQTNEGSIATYQARYGKLPLMPLSLSLWFLNDVRHSGDTVDDDRLFPRYALGDPNFKMQYGHRQLLARSSAFGFDDAPSLKASLDAYNGTCAKREQIEAASFLRFARNVVAALRFVVDARNYKPMLCSRSLELFGASSLLDASSPLRVEKENVVYALTGSTPQVVLAVLENSNQDEAASLIAQRVGKVRATGSTNREIEWIMNLIDLNIIPINVHALMRDIPLANLYNYEYTFEQMVALMYGEKTSEYMTEDPTTNDAATKTSRQMLLRLLAEPYLEVPLKLYGNDFVPQQPVGVVSRIFRGDNDLGMGRPKFLSDQLYNKALFGSVYLERASYSEAGPTAGVGFVRGLETAIAVPAAPLLPPRGTSLTFMRPADADQPPDMQVAMVSLGTNAKVIGPELDANGKERFDTRFVRNLFFITNVVRVLRLKLSRELTQSRNVLVASHLAVAPGVTEYGMDAFGVNEVLESRRPDGRARFADER